MGREFLVNLLITVYEVNADTSTQISIFFSGKLFWDGVEGGGGNNWGGVSHHSYGVGDAFWVAGHTVSPSSYRAQQTGQFTKQQGENSSRFDL